jgi:glycosyltransferase involved in cell wall biosynthesis
MVDSSPHILLLEPYYGGSHRAFLTGLQHHVDCKFTLLTLPARKWKMRMQLAAPWFAGKIVDLAASGTYFDAVLTSTFLDTAVLRSLLAARSIHLPLGIYFHENQFAYPGQVDDPGMFQFTAINFTSALCADRLAFNSRYNLETFLRGLRRYLKKATDMDLGHLADQIRAKAVVLYPGMDFSHIDTASRGGKNPVPIIVWNHRWEHDKDPETFFNTLFALNGIDYRLVVLGERFRRVPDIFSRAESRLSEKILHFGYAKDQNQYARLLARGDIVVSTALHEFFGMAVLEGVRAGCRPLVPDRLAYRELFADTYRYTQREFGRELARLLKNFSPLTPEQSSRMTESYNWPRVAPAYAGWLEMLCNERAVVSRQTQGAP